MSSAAQFGPLNCVCPSTQETPATPIEPIIENPFGVHDHDVLSGRGAFINGHIGNERFRKLCLARKPAFDSGSYTEKRSLASEVVTIIRGLEPPGRFLKRVNVVVEEPQKKADDTDSMPPRGLDGSWVELSDDKAIHKACQVMRDIARPDRVGEKGSGSKDSKGSKKKVKTEPKDSVAAQAKDSMTMLALRQLSEASAVEEAVAATEQALDQVSESVPKQKEDSAAISTTEV